MPIRELLLPILLERFSDRGPRIGSAPDPLATFAAVHDEVGDAKVWTGEHDVTVAVGDILHDHFFNPYADDHKTGLAIEGIVRDIVRFLEELFADRLLFWKSVDGGTGGWRERGESGHLDPLVMDDRAYRTYLWSGPVGMWRATEGIFARGHIRDDREYEIMIGRLRGARDEPFQGVERDLAGRLVAEYEHKR